MSPDVPVTGTERGLELAPAPVVVVCPPLSPGEPQPGWVRRVDDLAAEGVVLVRPSSEGPDLARWVGHVANAITLSAPTGPLLVVAAGASLRALPPLGVAMRSRRRSIAGYVLVDADPAAPMESGDDWPGAPVTYVGTGGSAGDGWRIAGLRGWIRVAGDPVVGIRMAGGLISGSLLSSQDTSGEG